MRPIVIGLLAALWAAVLPAASLAATAPATPKPPEITNEQKSDGMKAAPKLIAAANLPCQLSGARMIGKTTDPKTKAEVTYYEVACKASIGYVIVDHGAASPPSWATCLDQPRVDPLTGKTSAAGCFLPGNTDDASALAPFIAKANAPCAATKVRGIGHSDTTAFFEMACGDGRGFILTTSVPPDATKTVELRSCLNFPSGQLQCKLTEYADQMKVVDTYATQMGKPCTVKDKRYVGASADGMNFFEVACTEGKGYMLQVDNAGKVTPIDCAIADNIGGGCTLTNSRAAQTEEAGIYSKLAQKAGFNCDVSKYSPFSAAPAGDEAVELACNNRKDGAVGIFPTTSQDKPQIFDCIHSQIEGYRCGFTDADASIATLTADLNKLGKTSCVVSGERFIARTVDNMGYIEVACADGNPGYIVSYTAQPLGPKEAIPCLGGAQDIEGGCTLPTNKKK